MPNQRAMCSGSVTAAHTASTDAAIRMLRRTVNSAVSTTEGLVLRVVVMVVPLGQAVSEEFSDVCNPTVAQADRSATLGLHIREFQDLTVPTAW